MRFSPTILIFVLGVTFVIALEFNKTNTTQLLVDGPTQDTDTSKLQTSASQTKRRGRHLHVDIIELINPSKKTKRQIIKIPGDVSKVRLIRPPLNLKRNKAPQQFPRYPLNIQSGGTRRPNKRPQMREYETDDTQYYDSRNIKRNLKKPKVKGLTSQNVFEDEDFEFEKKGNRDKGTKRTPKIPKHVLVEYLSKYEGDCRQEKPKQENLKNRYNEAQSLYGYDSAASSIHMKQVPAPNLFPMKVVNPLDISKQIYAAEKPIFGSAKFHEDNYIPELNVKKLPLKGRQMQSIFTQQYTTHNPHVTANFGLGTFEGFNGFQYIPKGNSVTAAPYAVTTTFGKFSQPVTASSDQVVTAMPILTPGIRIIQPPQFRDVTVSHPSQSLRLTSSPQQSEEASSQRATMRDILEQDCPSHDLKGYCESPPRYPMQQIGNIVKKCASFMDVMNTQPFDEPHDVYHFSKRSDIRLESDNVTIPTDSKTENPTSWARSANDVSTACVSDFTVIEPGYAKEVISGRWFVVVQHPDTTIQRIVTDTCRNPGKPCGGLGELKCNKINGLTSKSTKCIQRFTHQRLISWDPESPDGCPRIRLFRFPSACTCHLNA